MSRTAKSWHAHANGNLCDGSPSDCPVTALRRARATIECLYGPIYQTATGHSTECAEPMPILWRHKDAASALLDGFSVEEVTAAEHTTDQPHE